MLSAVVCRQQTPRILARVLLRDYRRHAVIEMNEALEIKIVKSFGQAMRLRPILVNPDVRVRKYAQVWNSQNHRVSAAATQAGEFVES
jgi:hypothetical protein